MSRRAVDDSKLLRLIASLWYAKTLDLRASVPVPRDSHDIVSGADDPDRVLLIGNGPTHGWGTVTHELALTGQLGRACSRTTGRPTNVSYVGDEMMSIETVIPWLRDTRVSDYDLVLLVISLNDAVRLTPVAHYQKHMRTLLDKLVAEKKPSARVVVAGIHDVSALPLYPGLIGQFGQRAAIRLNTAVRELTAQYPGMRFMDLVAPQPEADRPHGSAAMYARWSSAFAETCSAALDEARALDVERRVVEAEDELWDWAPAAHIVNDPPESGWVGLKKIIDSAKTQLGADVAYVSVIDREQQYVAATTGSSGRSVPLELTHCNVTARGDDVVIVRNALKDPRFASSPFVALSQLRFYAGVPLKNAYGENIGTFCVASALPITRRDFSRERLIRYAEQAQAELQRIGAEHPVRD